MLQEMQDMALDFLDPAYYGISVGQALGPRIYRPYNI